MVSLTRIDVPPAHAPMSNISLVYTCTYVYLYTSVKALYGLGWAHSHSPQLCNTPYRVYEHVQTYFELTCTMNVYTCKYTCASKSCVNYMLLFLQFTAIDSDIVPLLEGPSSGIHTEPMIADQNNVIVKELGHYCLPQESDVEFEPVSSSAELIRADFLLFLQQMNENFKSSSAQAGTAVSKVPHSPITVQEGLNPSLEENNTFAITSTVSLPVFTVAVSAVIAAFISWAVTSKSKKKVRIWEFL